ncbi:MAG TPA: glycosyltransferase [Panacibacter sp.]|nr:glycosyltransferase [Panacibacter sp.]
MPLISICIPAYKRTDFLKRLLDSVTSQTFKDFEVIVSDDSSDNSVKNLLVNYEHKFTTRYFKNESALGTPANWNFAISKASGEWIKLMHDDDWFTHDRSLAFFAEAAKTKPDVPFLFSAFQNITHDSGKVEIVKCDFTDRLILSLSPLHLFKRVYVGNPSCTMIKRNIGLLYDTRFKFVVDFEYYIRCMYKAKSYHYIDKVLLNIGFHEDQVTKYTFLVPEVQIPENLILAEELGYAIFRNMLVYDYYWRMFRNLGVRGGSEIKRYYNGAVHPLINQIINSQKNIPVGMLKIGIVSKSCMFITYLFSFFTKTS